MKRLLGLLVSLVLLTGLLSGCGGTPAKKGAGILKNAPGQEMKESAWPRTIIDAAGNKVLLKQPPQRIALLHSLYLEHFFALGTPPTASMGASAGTAMKVLQTWETLKPFAKTADVMDLGSSRDLNLEAVLAANPDVIVTFKGRHVEKVYDQLVQIAPVILVDFSASWQDQTMACAEIVGREGFARDFIKEAETIIAMAKENLSQHKNKTMALFRTDGKSFISRGNRQYYETFGISKPAGYPDDYESMSLEAVAEMNPDYIVFQDSREMARAFVKNQEAWAIWQELDAVKQGHVFYFDDSLNTFGPLAMRLTADKLVEIYSGP
ncbi:ABC transporter substrate-binding protein [Acetonema longum]|uniref:Fe/B12 periplasmic-binding domain-containing protein n=1 Tax=Acetonema longum DSM 6540 TaxID=1009370 RepID=F7NM54_9FIRM|nr:ABC transporter substrate-binding protein [Acetonema longum]EGO62855.1 hypothetical protein ALO_15907 [Acetonema longum DSM 6540]